MSLLTLFEQVAAGYDQPALRAYAFAADRMLAALGRLQGAKLLDIACGTAHLAIGAAQAVGVHGRVHALDWSPAMLDQAAAKIQHLHLNNVDLHEMDATALAFRREYFDLAVCGFGLEFMPEPQAALQHWRQVIKPGGKLVFSTLADGALQQPLALLTQLLTAAGYPPAASWQTQATALASAAHCRDLLTQAGLQHPQVYTAQLGYHLARAEDCWEFLWHSQYRAWFHELPPSTLTSLRETYLAGLDQQRGEAGIYWDLPTHFAAAVV